MYSWQSDKASEYEYDDMKSLGLVKHRLQVWYGAEHSEELRSIDTLI